MGRETEKKYERMLKIMEALEEILCSYPGRGHKSVYTDMDALTFLARLLASGQICVQNYQYDYDDNIREDEAAVKIYTETAPQTRWRTGCHTQIEQIRMNALKQFSSMGAPVYDGHIYYADTGAVLVCGEILPYEIFRLFSDRPEAAGLYVFPYPFADGREKPLYFSFEPLETARAEMKKYVERKFEEACRIMQEADEVFHILPEADG